MSIDVLQEKIRMLKNPTMVALDPFPALIPEKLLAEAINTQALRLLRLFGNTTSNKVTPSVGPEQEYFLVDAEKFEQEVIPEIKVEILIK